MSGRGRGRGGFGGRGGRGGPPSGPVARDDDGTVLSSAPLGPPPMFPEIELPEHPEITAKETLLLLRRNDLLTYAKSSPFFLESSKQAKDGPDSAIDRYSERDIKRTKKRDPLTSAITLSAEYFPEELFAGDTKRSAKVTQHKQDAFWKSQGKKTEEGSGLHRLEHLAQLESKAGASGSGAAAAGDAEEQPPEDVPMDTDEEEDMENDDYYQGEHFDDDDGYDDAYDDGGGDEGPTY